MKGVDFPRITAPPEGPLRRNGTAPKRTAGCKLGVPVERARAARTMPQPIDATFATADAEPIDAPMWPLHEALWLQSEPAPSIPVWTGISIERHNRIPAPDFLHLDTAPADRPGALGDSREAMRPRARPELPQSGLAPLGWDPRAVGRKQGDA